MKQGLGIVIALGVGLFGQASALAQPPTPPAASPPPPPAAPPAAADPAAPPAPPAVAQPDPNAPPPSPNPNAPPPPPPPGADQPAPDAPPPLTLPPYLTGNTTTPLMPPVLAPPPPPPPSGATQGPAPGPGAGADTGVTPKKMEPRVRWRGTNLNWNNSFTTTAVGLGRDNIGGEGEQFTTGLGLTVNYYLIEPKDEQGNKRGYSLRSAVGFGFDTEMTNSDSSTKRNETQLRDTTLAFVFSKSIWKSADEEWAISTNLNGTFSFPTSKASYGEGIYLGVSPRASAFLSFPVLGKNSKFMDSILLGVGMRYDHRFSQASVPTNSDISASVVRQDLQGNSRPNDVLSGRFIDANSLRPSAFIYFDENILGGQLQVFVGGGLNYRLTHGVGNGGTGVDCTDTVVTSTGPACPTHGDLAAPNYTLNTSFSAGLTFFPMVEWGINVGYDNVASNLSPKSQIQDPFYSSGAQFSAGILVSLDAIYERLTGPERDEPFIVFGNNRKTPKTLSPTAQSLFF